jgi:pimeloyl-ACP methyl ester carboxylesterase
MVETESHFRGGVGPPLLLLHSGFTTWVEWRCVLPGLTAVRDVMAPTLPGSDGGPELKLGGRTMLAVMVDHVEGLLDEAECTEPVDVVGSSYGGVVALELAARGRARHVVALAPPWVAGRGLAWYVALFSMPVVATRLTEPVHSWAAGRRRAGSVYFHGSLRPAALDRDDLAAVWRSVGRFPWLRVARESRLSGPGLPAFERIRSPVTLVWGTGDSLVPGWMRRRWERAIPEAEVIELPGFPHMPHLRDPERVTDLITGVT